MRPFEAGLRLVRAKRRVTVPRGWQPAPYIPCIGNDVHFGREAPEQLTDAGYPEKGAVVPPPSTRGPESNLLSMEQVVYCRCPAKFRKAIVGCGEKSRYHAKRESDRGVTCETKRSMKSSLTSPSFILIASHNAASIMSISSRPGL